MRQLFYVLCCAFTAVLLGCESKEPSSGGNGTANGHDYVDLGLSVKWASMNVGAESVEDYGDYFAWGETKPKSTYTESSYTYSDEPILLPLSCDAANVNWGGDWRMPTKEEQEELKTKCTWAWTTRNGVEGYTVISKTNGNSIFLPAAGVRDDMNPDWSDGQGFYWSSSLFYWRYAHNLGFYSEDIICDYYFRYVGHSIRPVLAK